MSERLHFAHLGDIYIALPAWSHEPPPLGFEHVEACEATRVLRACRLSPGVGPELDDWGRIRLLRRLRPSFEPSRTLEPELPPVEWTPEAIVESVREAAPIEAKPVHVPAEAAQAIALRQAAQAGKPFCEICDCQASKPPELLARRAQRVQQVHQAQQARRAGQAGQAATLRAAAADGMPFCAICECETAE